MAGDARVIDGDTIQAAGDRIRLWGIDAPETNTEAGRKAKRWLTEFLSGKDVSCSPRGVDKYRRIVARCFIDGRDIAVDLIEAGHAWDWPKYSNGFYAK